MVLDSYDGEAPPLFWETFPKNHRTTPSSLINADLLRKLAFETAFPDAKLLSQTRMPDFPPGPGTFTLMQPVAP